jgi:hypothetical protein
MLRPQGFPVEQLSLLREKRDGATIRGCRRTRARPTVRSRIPKSRDRDRVPKGREMGHPSGGVVGLGSLRDERLAVVHVTNTKTRKTSGAPGEG